MKITRSHLRRLIKEELYRLTEARNTADTCQDVLPNELKLDISESQVYKAPDADDPGQARWTQVQGYGSMCESGFTALSIDEIMGFDHPTCPGWVVFGFLDDYGFPKSKHRQSRAIYAVISNPKSFQISELDIDPVMISLPPEMLDPCDDRDQPQQPSQGPLL